MLCVETTERGRERLGQQIADRRRELGLSISAAARLAQINRATWTGIETASRRTEEYVYGGIERALQWAPGSIAATLAGGDSPSQRDPHPETIKVTLPDDFDLVAELERIKRLNVSARTRWELARQITDLYEQVQAEHRAGQ